MPGTESEPAGLAMSLDAIIAKRGTGSSAGSGGRGSSTGDRGRSRGSVPGVRGGISKPDAGRGGRGPHNRNDTGGAGRGAAPMRGGFSGGRGGGRFGSGVQQAGGRGGPMQQQHPHQGQRGPMGMQQQFGAPAPTALEARLLEQARIIEMQQRQTMMLQAQLIQQQQMQARAAQSAAPWAAGPSDGVAMGAVPGSMPGPIMPGRGPRQAPVAPAEPVQQVAPEEPPFENLECYFEEETGNVVVMYEDTPIVTATPTGELMLSTGGWYTAETVAAMNYALKAITMKIIVAGDVEEGNWKVADGRALTRFHEDPSLNYMRVPSKGSATATRAQAILAWFQGKPAAPARGAARPAGAVARAGASQVQMEVDANTIRRLKAQGRY